MTLRQRAAAAGLAVFVGLCAGVPAAQQTGGRTDDRHVVTHGGRDRSYLLHVPSKRAAGPRPVVVAFHGGGGNAAQFRRDAGIDAVADREGFVVIYLDGTGPLRASLLLTFNAGSHCCGPALRAQVDDVGFAIAAIEDAARRVAIDRRRIYATGHSNGAIMAYRLAAERAEVVAAIAPVAGAMSLDRFAPSRPVPVLHIHSVDDPRALYGGGLGPPFPGTESRVMHAAVADSLARWIAHNGCPVEPMVAESRRGQPGSPDAGQTATRLVHAPCGGGAEVAHWKLTGVGHGWPGAAATGRERIAGPGTTVVDAAAEIWRFVSRFSR